MTTRIPTPLGPLEVFVNIEPPPCPDYRRNGDDVADTLTVDARSPEAEPLTVNRIPYRLYLAIRRRPTETAWHTIHTSLDRTDAAGARDWTAPEPTSAARAACYRLTDTIAAWLDAHPDELAGAIADNLDRAAARARGTAADHLRQTDAWTAYAADIDAHADALETP
jgi:hypothetical protein